MGTDATLRAEGLSPSKRALLERMLRGKGAGAASTATIPRRRGSGPAPLSFAQQRLWFIHQIDPTSAAYNVPNALRLRGHLDASVLRRCIAEVARRHESLRTRFEIAGGMPVQAVREDLEIGLAFVDLGHLPPCEREAEAERLAAGEATGPFDLTTGPLVRARLVRLAPEDHLFLLTIHHIVSDGWSMGVLVREIAALYDAFSAGRPSPLEALPIQYADFSAWQRNTLAGERLEREMAWWRERLTPLPPLLELPADRPRPPVQSFRGGVEKIAVPAGVADAMRAVARGEGATLFMALLAAFHALLARLTGEEDVTIGTGIANRMLPEVEPLIGFFVNALVLRVSCAGDPSFRELLGRAREVTLEAFAHQDLPFERLVEELQPARDLSRNPIFQVALALQNAPAGALAVPGLSIEAVPFRCTTTRFDLELHLWEEEGGGIEGFLFYSTDLFDAATASRIGDRYGAVLASVAADPSLALSRLPAATEEEIRLATSIVGRGAELAVPQRPVLSLFEEHAERTPGAPAIEAAGRCVTYGELDRAAGHLALRLLKAGAGRGSRVAVLADRSIEQVTAILAVAKTGAAWIPLDPANPAPRLVALIERSGAPIALAPRSLAGRARGGGRQVLEIDGIEAPAVSGGVTGFPALRGDDLAYVIFTSGSTGEPNGVEVTQAGLANLVAWHQSEFGVTARDRAPLIAGVGFDASAWEIWPCLSSGACLLVPEETTRLDPAALRDWLIDREITIAFLPTPLAEAVASLDWPRSCALRLLLTGGDRLHAVETGRLPFRLVNNYGPTETTVVATSGLADAGVSIAMPTIGRPIANAAAYVLDARLRPVPIGAAGELYVGGAGVARGYAGRPALTAARFLPDPWAADPSARMYRTGDRVRQLRDGRLEFLGRADAQVKIRGHRIEPAEVEGAIAACPGVEAAVVVARKDAGETRLVAYVVPGREGATRARWRQEHVARWRDLYDETYTRTPEGGDATFNITGWNSSYTGEPIDPEEMREWLEAATERILALSPRRVLEIGCGTGLLLSRIAPLCESYVATDFSRVSLDLVRRLVGDGKAPGNIRLLERMADDFEGLEPGAFDTVILNSVVQYFPDAQYLERVLEGALRVVAKGGHLFIGDVRDARLHDAFAASIALHGAAEEAGANDVRARAERIVAGEEELLVRPELFAAAAAREPRGVRAEALVKRGRADNELTRYRYDVILRVGGRAEGSPFIEVAWGEEAPRRLEDLLRSGAPSIFVRAVPRANVAPGVAAARLLEAPGPATAGEVRAAAEGIAAVHPEDLAAAGKAHGYAATPLLSPLGGDLFDIAFLREGAEHPAGTVAFPAPEEGCSLPLTNRPLRVTIAGSLIPELRAFAAERLPDAMVPSVFVLMDALPLTPNGKVDRRALPAPSAPSRPARATIEPRTGTEREIARIWSDLLDLDHVGVTDGFFDLGGHSLLATQVISRIRTALGAELPLRVIFETPTIEAIASFVDAQAGGSMEAGKIPGAERTGSAALSYAQQRLWFIDRLEPGIAAYNIPNALRLTGDLDVGALGRTLDEILRRHESLRTRFADGPDGPLQIVEAPRRGRLEPEDLSGTPRPDSEAHRLLAEEAIRPFDLARGPLLRARLLRLGPGDHVLSLTVHHIAADGWSMGLIVKELGALYAAYARGAASPLADLSIQYADWSRWQRRWLDAGEMERQLAWWRGALGGVEPLELPADRRRPRHPSYGGAALDVRIEARLVERIAQVARHEGATLHMALLAAFAAVLARWSGQEDFAVGTPVAGRTREEIEPLVGFFVNTLALRLRPGRDLTYRGLVAQVRDAALEAYAHQDVPFERIVEEIQPRRDTSRNPVFQALFGLHNVPFGELSLPGLALSTFEIEPATAQFDVEMSLFESGGAVTGKLHWSTDLFERPTMERFASHFLRFAEIAAGNPDAVIGRAAILPRTERALLDEAARGPAAPPAAEPTLARLFEVQADARPAAPALRAGALDISYADLEARANRLARLLARHGAGRGALVGLHLERGIDMIAALLGTLKIGAACVPLDPAYPPARIALMIAGARVKVVLTTSDLAGGLPPPTGGILRLDIERQGLDALDGSRLSSPSSPDDLAYVIYTSGSTGEPKGVAMRQGPLLGLAAWQRERSGGRPGRRTLQYSPLSFDVSFQEIFSTFAEGGTLVLTDEDVRRDPEALVDLLVEEKVERIFLPFVALEGLAEAALPRARGLRLREVITAGEQLRVTEPIRRLFESLGGATLDNQYGPTESHVATAGRLEGPPAAWPILPPIGGPLPGAIVRVLDEWMEPVPVGILGEIFIGGTILARGYMGHGDRTAERFIPDPDGGGGRLYRTGDTGRLLADGRLEFAGRRDRQVKVRGYRVEPGEIESAIAKHAGVRAVAVEPRSPGGAGARLVAWVVPGESLRGRVSSLRGDLAAMLPDHLVPSAWVEMESLPLTPSGKVDRRRLPDPAAPEEGAALELSPLESIVAAVFEQTLGVRSPGRDADFFDLGGHSLLATRAISRLRRITGAELPLKALFESPTVRRLAIALGAAVRGGEACQGPIHRAGHAGRAPASFQQERIWFLDQIDASGSLFTLLAALRLRGDLDADALGRALSEIARRHEPLRTRFESEGGRPFQVIEPASEVELRAVDLEGAADTEAALREQMEAEARAPFDLARGPLWRASLIRLGPDDNALCLAMHHIVTDGWSMGVLLRELGILYAAFTAGAGSPLDALPIQYADYAAWQRDWMEGGELERQLAWWRGALAGVPPLDLPADRPRPPSGTNRGARVRGAIEGGFAERIRALAREEGATLHMVLLAAYALVLARWSGQDDFAVGTPVANRTREETEGLIGFFVNTLALRVDLRGEGLTFRGLLGRIRETALGAYAHQDLPFESILETIRPPRDLSRSPVFQVWFNLVNVPEEEPRFGGLEAHPMGVEAVEARFDLSLYAHESGAGIHLDAIYKADLFDEWRIRELLDQITLVLEQAVDRAGVALPEISLVTAEARAGLPDEEAPLSAEWRGAVQDLFSREAARDPSAPAVVDPLAAWSYGELDARANQLAHWLQERGIGKGESVAIYAHRSASTVWAILGVLKSGAAFTMLDPAHPVARLVACLEEARPRAFVEIEAAGTPPGALAEFVRSEPRAARLALPAIGDAGPRDPLSGLPREAPAVAVSADDLACVTFTSGSTGRPKGVLGRHGSLTHFQPFMQRRFGIGRHDRFSMLSGLAHDPLQRDVFTALLSGATLCIPDAAEIDPARLAAWAARERVTVMVLTPAMAKLLASDEGPDAHRLAALRLAFLVGEQLTRRDVERLRALAPAATIVNLYGTTETQRAVGYFVVAGGGALRAEGGAPIVSEAIPVGVGMEGAQLLVRSEGGRPAGLGELGEVWVRSPHLALGYLDDALTRERFRGAGGARAYRTGDLGRYLHGGSVTIAGRRDGQVNVRGFRVELGEVESALASAPGVRDAAAALTRDGRLVGYVTAREGARIDPRAVRAAAALRLPTPIVPAAIVILDALPLTPNGKVDRAALPEPCFTASGLHVPPRTPDEEIACGLFAEALGVERVGADDDFFDLGGHSLLAARLLARAAPAFGAALPLRTLFESPTPAGLARAAAAARRAGVSPPPGVARAPEAERRRLSYAQSRLWFLDQLEPGGSAYNVATGLRLTGALDAAALGRALAEIERRHEALRARFIAGPAGPEQLFDAPRPDLLVIEDLSQGAAPGEEGLRRVASEAGRPFDLARGPLWRALLVRLSESEHLLALVLHHIVTDGWSMEILVRELALLYEAFAQGLESPLEEPALHYADWAAWQRSWLAEGEMDRQLAFWRGELEGIEPLEIPTDRPRPPRRALREANVSFELPPDDALALARFARSEGSTLFHALLACFMGLLSRMAGREEIVVGTPVANRTLPEAGPLVGYFANTLPIRSRVEPAMSLRALVARVREKTLSAHAHQDVPFEVIVEALDPERDLSRNPVFDTMFVLQHAGGGPASTGGLAVERIPADTGSTPFDLTMVMAESGGSLFGSIVYDPDLFDGATADRFAARFLMLVRALGRDPDARLMDLDLRAPAERALVEEVNATAVARPERLAHALFEEQARRSPGAPAVNDEEETLTYGGLDAAAGRIARRLARAGVGPEIGVGLLAGRTVRSIAGILGIWKSGGVLVPLDASLPAARLAAMIRDAGVRAILSERGLEACLPPGHPPIVPLDAADPAADREPPPDPRLRPANAAYVIFTSGSTGAPKGSVVEHRSIADRALSAAADYGLGPGDRMLHFLSPLFDAALDEILPTLSTGGCIVVHPDPRGETPDGLLDRCRDARVTVAHLPVGLLHELADEVTRTGRVIPESVRLIVTGGECPGASRIAALLDAARAPLTVVNVYGPTEATVYATSFRVDSAGASRDPVPMGRPAPNTTVRLLDDRMKPVPVGLPGEIYIGGMGLARGYAGRPAESAGAFVPDPFSPLPGARLYRTGDLARLLASGDLVFLGRRDGQVKLRGYRIETGEVEAALTRVEGIREVAVVLREEGAEPFLAAYVIPSEPSAAEPDRIRAALRAILPGYMVPQVVMALPAMPRTATGKIDRRALPPPPRPTRSEGRIPPRDDLERRIARRWAETLGGEPPGVQESFFEAGGSSLLAVRLVATLRREEGIELRVASVFREPTVAGLAALVRGDERARSPLVPLRAGGGLPPVVCFHAAGGGVSDLAALGAHLDPRRPVYGVHGFDGAAHARVEEAAACFAAEIRRAVPEGAIDLVGWSYGGLVAFESALALREAGREVGALVLIDVPAPGEGGAGTEAAGGGQGIAEALAAARASGALPAGLRDEEAREWLAGIASRTEAARAYRPRPYPGDVVVVRGSDSATARTDDPALGWRRWVTGKLTLEWAAGSHDSILRGEGARALAAIVEQHASRPPRKAKAEAARSGGE